MTPFAGPEIPTFKPIGVIRTPFADRASAPRQPAAAEGVKGTVELAPDGRFEHAVTDLGSFRRIWVLFWFHMNVGWKARVRPPRSAVRRGVFATRSPHRPNPIGMSVLRLERIEGTILHVLDVDMVDGTPLLDIKPYLPYADSVPDAGHGWLDDPEPETLAVRDPRPGYEVRFTDLATAELAFLVTRGVELRSAIAHALSLGPAPHPYRRIRKERDHFLLAVREWRAHFTVEGALVTVVALRSGYRPSQIYGTGPGLGAHRAYIERFGADGTG